MDLFSQILGGIFASIRSWKTEVIIIHARATVVARYNSFLTWPLVVTGTWVLNSESIRHILNSPSPEQTRAGARKRNQQETSAKNLQSDPEDIKRIYIPKNPSFKGWHWWEHSWGGLRSQTKVDISELNTGKWRGGHVQKLSLGSRRAEQHSYCPKHRGRRWGRNPGRFVGEGW